jgi:hypothetical protein
MRSSQVVKHLGNGWLFSAANGGWEFPVFWAVTLIVQALLGDGPHALGSRFDAGSAKPAPIPPDSM